MSDCDHRSPKCKHGDPTKFELKIAKMLCDAQGEYIWKYIKDVDGNPSTAFAYYDYIAFAQKVIKKLGLTDED